MNPILSNNRVKYSLLVLALLLFTLSFFFNKIYTNRSTVTDEVRLAQKYLQKHEEDFNQFLTDTALLFRLAENVEPLQDLEKTTSKKYGIFLYKQSDDSTLSLRFWNTQANIPPESSFRSGEIEEGVKLENGYYFLIKKFVTLQSGRVIVYATIPFRSAYWLPDYLPEKFAYSSTADKRVQLSDSVTAYRVKSISGKPIFYLKSKNTGIIPYNNALTILLRFSGLLLLLLFVHLIAESLSQQRLWKGVLFLGGSLLVIRMVIYWAPSLLNLRQFELFDPTVYGSTFVQRSLGDLLMNSVFFCWLVLFTWYKVQKLESFVSTWPQWMKMATGLMSLILLILSTFLISSIIRSIVADSKISFDVTNFWSLDRYTVVGFFVLATLSLSYYYFTQLLFRIIFPFLRGEVWLVYFAIAFSGLVFLTLKTGDPTVLFYIPVLVWLLIYTWLVNREGVILNRIRINIAGIIFWIFVFSVSIAAIMLVENKKAEWARRKYYAGKLTQLADESTERMMSIAFNYLDNDFLSANLDRFRSFDSSIEIRDSINAALYSPYSSQFETKIYVYDSTGKGLVNPDPTKFDALRTIVSQQSHATRMPGTYYYETAFDQYTFITEKNIQDSAGRNMGYMFIISNPHKYPSDALLAELFKQNKSNDPENSPIYSYAIYNQRKLTELSNKYPFATRLTDAQVSSLNNETTRKVNGDYDELWFKADNQRIVVITRKQDTLIETITLFSYIFSSFLFLILVVQILSLLVKAVYDPYGFRRFFHFNIRNQVHSTIIFISIFSFIIIGIATINFFKTRYNRTNSDKLSKTMKIMVAEMEDRVKPDDLETGMVVINDSATGKSVQSLVQEVSEIHGVDVNVYDLAGDMQISSEDNVYERGVLSKKMEPGAFFRLSRLNQVQHVQEEKIANLTYLSIYGPVRDKEGKAYAYIGIPYFTSQPELDQEISNFIVTVINLNAFILLVAGLIALYITNRITRSFSIISNKMKDVNLGKMNEEIEWNRDDEIGDLVKEYNKMVAKLEESAAALAKTEREEAWREMARQVAHEIKNPLTPMKLSIQYLQKAINNNQPNVKELSSSVANTLVEQIDHLSKIAADFSQFANIGNTNIEEFDLHSVIRSLQELYSADPNTEFIWNPVNRKALMHADKTQMNRLFTNLFANAVEARGSKDHSRIEVMELVEGGMIRISIKDNGEGIAEEMQSRIFIPNFTTKSSGTGLGLAMCKGIVEQARGRIWFETKKGFGTTFHVELPIVNPMA
ncbi:MAG: histidine kinase [Citrobacter freundii]|nr:MAG: histidine kinase [Citrobacter freundii]